MYACIDLGSNSFHLLIANWHDGEHEIVERFSEKVQLGEGLLAGGCIHDDAMRRGLDCLETFRDALARYPIQHSWAVGTNALRSASNAEGFLSSAARLGFSIDVISGLEEAALVYAGVLSALPDKNVSRLVIDIGGGSTELVVGQGAQCKQTLSMQIGCISWRDRWFADLSRFLPGGNLAGQKTVLQARLDQAVGMAEDVFSAAADALRGMDWQEVYASSGTAKMLSAICNQYSAAKPVAEKGGWTGDGSSGVSLDTLRQLQADVLRTALDPDFALPGLKPARRELVLPGWAVLTGFMQAVQVDHLQFSPAALREGMLHYLVESSLKHVPPLHALKGC